ncbi:MAG: hypothetical protein EOP02_01390 [Proteobacteria bacterium]|nr:MAG: hypothetical protein EOP02_01390 [Pseudomonadota bacterium]
MHVVPELARKIDSSEDLQEIATLIREWKIIDNLGRIATQDHWFFGRDKLNNPVSGRTASFAFHVHLRPFDPVACATWDQQADDERLTSYARTSDRLAVYSLKHAEPSAGILLLDIVGDPGGHAIFNREDPVYTRLLRAWDRAAYRHQDVGLGALPAGVLTL